MDEGAAVALTSTLDGAAPCTGLKREEAAAALLEEGAAAVLIHQACRAQPIIHGAIRSSGVLLTDALTAKVAGFGLAAMPYVQALQKRRGGEAVVAMDPRMRRSPASVATAERMMALAEQCVAPARKDRPSMRRCSELLWAIRRDYHRREQPRADAIAEERDDEWVIR
ncbi:hypothetical protein EJB05_03782, partial [Eragrostis curvula]